MKFGKHVVDSIVIIIVNTTRRKSQVESQLVIKFPQNYKKKSPLLLFLAPLKCTRPNEEWNSCTNSCLRENCYDLKESHISCKPWGCEPRCACKNGFYRNDSRICVPASQCCKQKQIITTSPTQVYEPKNQQQFEDFYVVFVFQFQKRLVM